MWLRNPCREAERLTGELIFSIGASTDTTPLRTFWCWNAVFPHFTAYGPIHLWKVTDSQRAFEMQVECRLETVLNYQKALEKVCWPFVHEGRRRLLSRIRLLLASVKYRGVQFTDRGNKGFLESIGGLWQCILWAGRAEFFSLTAKPDVHFVSLLQWKTRSRSLITFFFPLTLAWDSLVAKHKHAHTHTHTHTHTHSKHIHLQAEALRLTTPDGGGWLAEPLALANLRLARRRTWLTDAEQNACVCECVRVCVCVRLDLLGYPTLPCLIRQLHGTARGVLLSGGQGYQHTAYLLQARRVYRSD